MSNHYETDDSWEDIFSESETSEQDNPPVDEANSDIAMDDVEETTAEDERVRDPCDYDRALGVPNHEFIDCGVRRYYHHYVRYAYPDLSLLPPGARLRLSPPKYHDRRIHPGPLPQDPELYEHFSIVQLPHDDEVMWHWLRDDRYERSVFNFNSWSLARAMLRVSTWPGETRLSMVIYSLNGRRYVRVKRSSTLQNHDWDIETEEAGYEFDYDFWHSHGPVIPEKSEDWFYQLEVLETRRHNRAWWAVQDALEKQNHPVPPVSWFEPGPQPPDPYQYIRTSKEAFAEVLKPVLLASLSQDMTECSICGEEFTEGNEQPVKLPCGAGHVMGADCIKQWLRPGDDRPCPICREKIFVLPVVRSLRWPWPWWVVVELKMRELEPTWQGDTSHIIIDAHPLNFRLAFMERVAWCQGTEYDVEGLRASMPYLLGEDGALYSNDYQDESEFAKDVVGETLLELDGQTLPKQNLLRGLWQKIEEEVMADADPQPMYQHLERALFAPGFRQYFSRLLSRTVYLRQEDFEELERIEAEHQT